MIEAKLTARLKTLGVTVYPTVAPMNFVTPCAVYTRTETDVIQDLDDDGGAEIVTMQIDVYSTKALEAATLARTIRTNLRAWDADGVEYVSMPVMETAGEAAKDLELHRNVAHYRFFVTDAE